MYSFWRHRRKLGPALKELGCGLLTVLLFTAPLWVLTVAWRGPGYALAILAGLVIALAAVVFVGRWLRRARRG